MSAHQIRVGLVANAEEKFWVATGQQAQSIGKPRWNSDLEALARFAPIATNPIVGIQLVATECCRVHDRHAGPSLRQHKQSDPILSFGVPPSLVYGCDHPGHLFRSRRHYLWLLESDF